MHAESGGVLTMASEANGEGNLLSNDGAFYHLILFEKGFLKEADLA